MMKGIWEGGRLPAPESSAETLTIVTDGHAYLEFVIEIPKGTTIEHVSKLSTLFPGGDPACDQMIYFRLSQPLQLESKHIPYEAVPSDGLFKDIAP